MGPIIKIQSHQQTRTCGGFVWLSNVQSDRDNIFSTEWFSFFDPVCTAYTDNESSIPGCVKIGLFDSIRFDRRTL